MQKHYCPFFFKSNDSRIVEYKTILLTLRPFLHIIQPYVILPNIFRIKRKNNPAANYRLIFFKKKGKSCFRIFFYFNVKSFSVLKKTF
jgi:hypothetical protein